jgi:iron complex outermembrane recepter protein
MKPNHPLRFLLIPWLILLLAITARGADPGAGQAVISGSVSNQGTGVFLEGATVRVAGTHLVAATDRDGTYRLAVPAGNQQIVVSYTGLDPETITVSPAPGETVRRDVALSTSIYQLTPVVVAGEREGNALAVTLQRLAPNVKNVVSADAFGSLAGNPAELLERLPGVSYDRVGGDIRFISIRGIEPDLNSVQVDGNRVASIANTRGFQFQNIGSDHIESMELVKAPTPDIDADSIGGSVNLRSRSAFDLTSRRMSYSLGIIRAYGRDPQAPHPAATFSYSNVFGADRRLGISLSAGWRQHTAAIHGTTQLWQNTTTIPAFRYSLAARDFANTRTRWGGGVKIDYKLSPASMVFANFTASPHRENNANQNWTLATNQTVATVNAQGQLTGTGGIMPGFTANRTEVRPVAASNLTINSNHLKRGASAFTTQIGGRTRKEGWQADYDASYSFAQNHPNTVNSALVLSGLGWVTDNSRNTAIPTVTFTGGPDPMNLDNFRLNPVTLSSGRVKNEIMGTQANFRRNFDVGVPAYIKTGVKVRQEYLNRWRSDRRWTFVGPDGRPNSNDENLRQFIDEGYMQRATFPYGYPMFSRVSPKALYAHRENNPTQWVEDDAYRVQQALTGRQSVRERVSAAYLLGNTRLGRVSILGGLRVEQTDVRGEGPVNEITPEERARRAAWTGTVTPEEQVRRVQAQYGSRRAVERDYRNVFPGVHFKYEPINGLIGRLSYSNGIGRPSYSQIIPNDVVDHDTQIVRVNNPGLRPQYSDNFDVSIEYYFEPVGMVSASAFLKEIKDFIYNTTGSAIPPGADNGFDGDYVGYELRSQANGGFARVRGFELSYQQQFTFLPGWWSGFGLFANYTQLETHGDFGNIGNVVRTGQLPGFVPRSANAGISYIRGKMNFRLHYGHKGTMLGAWNASEARRRWEVAQHRFDLKLKYIVSRRLELYFDAYNLFNEKNNDRHGFRHRDFADRQDPQIHAGISGRF